MSIDDARLFNLPSVDEPYEGDVPEVTSPFQARAVAEGADYDDVAFTYLESAGGSIEDTGVSIDGIPIDAIVRGANGKRFLIAAHGTIDDGPKAGLRRVDTVHKIGHRAFLLPKDAPPLLVLTSHLPRAGGKAAFYLARSADRIFDVVATTADLPGFWRLKGYLTQTPPPEGPTDAAWRLVVQQGRLMDHTDEDGNPDA
ncbi:MAG: hypothetical protein QOH26_1015 [Actinomycetota bacterium]|jgi:hypothetical protein|nr:hypothetical protein [Actinomycetota bacterium]